VFPTRWPTALTPVDSRQRKKREMRALEASPGQCAREVEPGKSAVYTREESYTSKASFLDLDFIPNYGEKPFDWKPSGRRIKRGLYRCKSGLINADVNGAVITS
jgi:hypothetical protein